MHSVEVIDHNCVLCVCVVACVFVCVCVCVFRVGLWTGGMIILLLRQYCNIVIHPRGYSQARFSGARCTHPLASACSLTSMLCGDKHRHGKMCNQSVSRVASGVESMSHVAVEVSRCDTEALAYPNCFKGHTVSRGI